ncbi:hypothetical protein DMA11_03290 [Marinilabiliaceae bacterium JC017]|nr:hypothetical protein DMA11_03290 [Marinilabiliaceae bacterium JC017]
MEIKKIAEILDARIVCGEDLIDKEIHCGFASDLMSDVLTLDSEGLVLVTGLANLQTIRTAEMADITCVVFVRDKTVTPEMRKIAGENNMVLLECRYSMFRTIGKLYEAGLAPVY